jgi:anti-sigma B factor antagonist
MVLQIEKKRIEPDITVIEISGKVALGRESGQIEHMLVEALQQGERKIIFDLSGVNHIDSTGIGIIAYCFGKVTQAGGQLRIAGARGPVMEVFKITRLDTVVKFYPDVASASQGMQASGQPA